MQTIPYQLETANYSFYTHLRTKRVDRLTCSKQINIYFLKKIRTSIKSSSGSMMFLAFWQFQVQNVLVSLLLAVLCYYH